MNSLNSEKTFRNEKVLLRERKRHTTCRVASTRRAGQGGYTGWGPPARGSILGGAPLPGVPQAGPPLLAGGYPGQGPLPVGEGTLGGTTCQQGGVPWAGPPYWQGGGYPGWGPSARGIPQAGPPYWGVPQAGPPPSAGWGTPHHELDGVLPPPTMSWMGYPPPTISWMGYPPPPTISWMGYPPRVWTDTQSENITSSRTTYAVGKNLTVLFLTLAHMCRSNCTGLPLSSENQHKFDAGQIKRKRWRTYTVNVERNSFHGHISWTGLN